MATILLAETQARIVGDGSPTFILLPAGSVLPEFRDKVFFNGQLHDCLNSKISKNDSGKDEVVIRLMGGDVL